MTRTPLALLLLPLTALAQTKAAQSRASVSADTSTHLPVTHVSLYKNGVGFFEHAGHITGNAHVTIDFSSAQLNDVLQTLTALDLNGGRIAGAGYNSTAPLDQQLKNLPIALSDDPTAADFYAAIRGARVAVHAGPVLIIGRLLAIESRTAPAPATSDDASSKPAPTREYLTVVSDSGEVRTVELTSATSVRLLDTALHTDVSRYLQLLDANRSQSLRHLTVEDRGTGTRELHLSYLSEVPIWKSTYRILFTSTPGAPGPDSRTRASTATFQGWSVVDNTTGTDWNNVQLSLIAGAPQSFIQPLSQPIYSRRPEIPIAQEAQLAPQTFDSSINAPSTLPRDIAMLKEDAAPPSPAEPLPRQRQADRFTAGFLGQKVAINPGAAGNIGGLANGTVSYESAAAASLNAQTTTTAFDDYFAYTITEPVTIRKNESALVPILQAKVAADPVTIVSFNGSTTTQPLRALWVTNTSGLTLDRGSFTIVEDGAFGGEGLLDPIHPDEKRLLSYAADQAIHATVPTNKFGNRRTGVSAAKGVLILRRGETHELDFTLHNAAPAHRSIVLELPVAGGFKIDTTPAPIETTASVYRFRLEADAGQTVTLHVGGSRNSSTRYVLTNSDDNQLNFILNETGHDARLEAALQPVLQARRSVSDAQAAVDQTNSRVTGLRADEDRQRANITALGTADKSSRERFVRDLNATEDQIANAQKELATRTATLDAARTDLANRIQSLQLDETL